MNRRDLLKGFAVVAIAGTVPAALLIEETGPEIFFTAWWRAAADELSACNTNVLIYGTGAIQYIDEFPFIRNVPLEEIFQ